jgi:cation diffusion facilitator family transporter
MSAHCHDHCSTPTAASPRYRRVLWIALLVNAAMFLLEVYASKVSDSVSLLADAIDFFADAGNYAISLAVLSMAAVWRARAAMLKAATMLAMGLFVLARAGWAAYAGSAPEPATMGAIGMLALLANGGVAWLLYAWRDGDANMRSVWLCTRNDAIGNIAVMLAALGVFGTGSRWPDLVIALGMASLAISAAISILRQARQELTSSQPQPQPLSQAHGHEH